MEQRQFDKKIKDSLAHLEVSFDAAPWERIEQALDAMETLPVTPVAENDFDAFISSKLENLSIPAKQPNWERMSAALDEAGMSDAFDQEVKSKINTINPVYQPSHWELLATQLRREKAIKESLYKNKIAEFTLLLILLLNFYQYFPYPATASLPIATTKATDKIAIEEKEILSEPILKKETPAPLAKKEATSSAKEQVEVATKEDHSNTTDQVASNQSLPIADNKLYVLANSTPIDIKGISSQPIREEIQFGIDGKTGLTITVSEMAKHLGRTDLPSDLFVETIPSLVPASLATAKIIPLDCEHCKRFKAPALFRFGMVGQIGLVNAIHNSTQEFYTEKNNHLGSTYGSGFTLGFKYSKWEFETGLIYAAKRYNHIAFAKHPKHDAYARQLKGLSIETLQVPFNFRYNYAVSNSGKLHLYVQSGIAFNLVLREEQDILKIPVEDAIGLDKVIDPAAYALRGGGIQPNKGLLGGDFNSFLIFNLGAGAEYYLSPKWSVFFQPDFQYYLSQSYRIGPTKDKIHALPLSFGVRSSFY